MTTLTTLYVRLLFGVTLLRAEAAQRRLEARRAELELLGRALEEVTDRAEARRRGAGR